MDSRRLTDGGAAEVAPGVTKVLIWGDEEARPRLASCTPVAVTPRRALFYESSDGGFDMTMADD